MVDVSEIERAAALIQGRVVATPTLSSGPLSELTGMDLRLKLENLQYTASFKDRGSLVKLESLDADERARGVIAVSAGNHAQGVAHHARRLDIPATIVVPEGTPNVKVRRTEHLGARVELHGETIEEAREHADRLRAEAGFVFIHPYDDPAIIAGQGTVGLEMAAQTPDLDVIVAPIGGGGLISGLAIAAKALLPGIKIIGVEANLHASMHAAIRGGDDGAGGQTLADGIAVKAPGGLTQPLIEALVDDLVLVTEGDIERAIALLLDEEKLVAEGAGAAALAAVLNAPERFEGRTVGVVVSGGNIDVRLLTSLLTRALSRDGRVVRLRLEIADRPGALAAVSAIVAHCRANILEVAHQRGFLDVPARRAELDLLLETRDRAHVEAVVTRLGETGYKARVLSDLVASEG